MSIRTFEIIKVDDTTFVIIIITSSGVVKNKLVKTHEKVGADEIELLSHVLNHTLTGVPLEDINESRFDIVRRAAGLSVLLIPVAEFIAEFIAEFTDRKYFFEGASKLLNFPEYRDVNKARELIEFISDKNSMTAVNSTFYTEIDGIKIAIGAENGQNPLSDSSMIYASYSIGSLGQGIIGIVGPKRMDYANISAQLSVFAKELSKLIAESFDNQIPFEEEEFED